MGSEPYGGQIIALLRRVIRLHFNQTALQDVIRGMWVKWITAREAGFVSANNSLIPNGLCVGSEFRIRGVWDPTGPNAVAHHKYVI